MNFFSCFLSRKPFVSSVLSTNLAGWSFLHWRFFPLPITLCSFLPSCASAEISADNLTGLPLYIASDFSIAAFKILFIFNFFHFNHNVVLVWSSLFNFVWDSLCFLDLGILFSPQVSGFFQSFFLEVDFLFFSFSPLLLEPL